MTRPTPGVSSRTTSSEHTDGHAPVRRLTTETKAAYKTTEMFVYLAAVAAVLIASQLVGTGNGHIDYFRADKAWFYVVLLTIGYLISRGLAKSGGHDRYDDR
jgi:hypothetical protein